MVRQLQTRTEAAPVDAPKRLQAEAAHGFSAKKDLLAQLLALNQQIAEKIEQGSPVTTPGVPRFYPDPKIAGTKDCIVPPGAPEPQNSDGSTAQSYADAAHYYTI